MELSHQDSSCSLLLGRSYWQAGVASPDMSVLLLLCNAQRRIQTIENNFKKTKKKKVFILVIPSQNLPGFELHS